jgi:hypothetical protein
MSALGFATSIWISLAVVTPVSLRSAVSMLPGGWMGVFSCASFLLFLMSSLRAKALARLAAISWIFASCVFALFSKPAVFAF